MYLILIGYTDSENIPREAYRYDLNHEIMLDVSAYHPQKVYDLIKHRLRTVYDDSSWTWAIVLRSANPHLFDIVGTMIAKGQVDIDEWGIEVSYYSSNVAIARTTYDKEGFLINWPYGAFDFVID